MIMEQWLFDLGSDSLGQDSGASPGWFLPSLWMPILRLRSPVSIPREVYKRTDAAGVAALCPCHSA